MNKIIILALLSINSLAIAQQAQIYNRKTKKPEYFKALEMGDASKALHELQYVHRARFVDPGTHENGLHVCARTNYQLDLLQKLYHELYNNGEVRVNALDHKGYTPLALALENNNHDFVLFLISAGADLSMASKTPEMKSALFNIALSSINYWRAPSLYAVVITRLIRENLIPDFTEIKRRVKESSHTKQIVSVLLRFPNCDIDKFTAKGATDLYHAMAFGNVRRTIELLEKGANPLAQLESKSQLDLLINQLERSYKQSVYACAKRAIEYIPHQGLRNDYEQKLKDTEPMRGFSSEMLDQFSPQSIGGRCKAS